MHIGIVLHPFGGSGKGLEQYVFESARSMIEEAPPEHTFTVFVKGKPDTSMFDSRVTIVNLPSSSIWNMHLFTWRNSCDAFIFYTESAPFFLWKKSIIVFFDAAYFYFGGSSFTDKIQRRLLVWWRTRMMRTVRHIVVISEASKDDLVKAFHIAAEKITVVYPGFKSLVLPQAPSPYAAEKPYFMYIGPIKERKNVFAIVQAFNMFRKQSNLSHKLFLVGRRSKGDYEEKVNRLIDESPYKDSIIFKTSVSDEELPEVYAHAEALVFPSLLEGFGLPVLEALSLGCRVITSQTTSTKEAAGKVGLLVNPTKPEEIAAAMMDIASKPYDREDFLRDAALQCGKFSWKKSGKEWNQLFI